MKLLAFLVAIAAFIASRPFPPVVTMANQLVAVLGWGLVLLLAPAPPLARPALRSVAPLLIVFALVAGACVWSVARGALPTAPGICTLGLVGLALALALHGASAGAADVAGWFRPFAIALAVIGVCCAFIACLQIFAIDLIDNDLIALPTRRGRAGGNIGQPNQFADAMLWGLIALVPLAQARYRRAPQARWMRLEQAAWFGAGLFMILGVVLAGSRTGMVVTVLIALWGLFDRNLVRPLRVGLALAPVAVVALQWAVGAWAHAHALPIVMTDRSDTTSVFAFRDEIWASSLALIKAQPWLGVGWGQFNFAWTLTPSFSRGAGLVDNAHDLPLQLAVELGVPAAVLMISLLLFALWTAVRRLWRSPGDAGVAGRGALMIVVVLAVHSMLEYPLWYAYLLLPTAWAFGLTMGAASAMGPSHQPAAAEPAVPIGPLRAWRVLGLLMVVLAGSAWLDYLTIVDLFLPRSTSLPLVQRIQRAEASPLFANHADYVAATDLPLNPATLPLVERASHVLLNGRLMYAWAILLNERGEVDKARYMAARLREFNLSGPKPWFAPCDDPAVTAKPFQCLPPAGPVSWRDFR